jgi:hypothetical protein
MSILTPDGTDNAYSGNEEQHENRVLKSDLRQEETKNKLKYFPITSYAIVMGLSGLTIVFGKFYHMQWLPKYFYDGLLFFTFSLFLFITLLYGLKTLFYFEEVQASGGNQIGKFEIIQYCNGKYSSEMLRGDGRKKIGIMMPKSFSVY